MILGKVVGTVVSTQKDKKLEGHKLLIVRQVGIDMELQKSFVVVADCVGAGVGEMVFYVTGSSARQTGTTKDLPIDSLIIGIIDHIEIEGKVIYKKQGN